MLLSSFKRPVACFKGQRVGNPQPPQVSSFVGSSNEATFDLEGIRCDALTLIDTGSMISTISESFAFRAKLTVLLLQNLIRIEGAGRHQIQYLGYVKFSVCLPELNKFFDVLFLVVPGTPYHGRVPVLIGSSSFSEAVSRDQRLWSPWRLAMQSYRSEKIWSQIRYCRFW